MTDNCDRYPSGIISESIYHTQHKFSQVSLDLYHIYIRNERVFSKYFTLIKVKRGETHASFHDGFELQIWYYCLATFSSLGY